MERWAKLTVDRLLHETAAHGPPEEIALSDYRSEADWRAATDGQSRPPWPVVRARIEAVAAELARRGLKVHRVYVAAQEPLAPRERAKRAARKRQGGKLGYRLGIKLGEPTKGRGTVGEAAIGWAALDLGHDIPLASGEFETD